MTSATAIPISPNLQLVYVSDIERSTYFYKTIFKKDPVFISPRYVAFSTSGEALFAIWTGGDKPDRQTPRYCEIGIMLPTEQDVDNLYNEWKIKPDIHIVKELYTEGFGRTFLINDPDGHIIRVCPMD
ncbi:VOC family protein [Spirobacillus cienkowskii]|uniref:VOC family protein n=1 Tax=Spirobacillus cienkowskii TaxID=495820 RepID=UPI0030D006DD